MMAIKVQCAAVLMKEWSVPPQLLLPLGWLAQVLTRSAL